jgi:hypothetical protein
MLYYVEDEMDKITTIGEVIAEKNRKRHEVIERACMYSPGTLAEYVAGTLDIFRQEKARGATAYLYVEAGDRGMIKIRYITADWWVNTDGNGGFGQSWCCAPDEPVYMRR